MFILKKLLAADAPNENYVEAPIHHHTVGHDLPGGGFRQFRISPDALIVSDGKAQVVIPLAEIAALAEPHLKRSPVSGVTPKRNGRQ